MRVIITDEFSVSGLEARIAQLGDETSSPNEFHRLQVILLVMGDRKTLIETLMQL